MRPIDADAAILDARANYGGVHDAVLMEHFINSQPTIPFPPNDPLTIEELREMDGEPVWVVSLNGGKSEWGLVYNYHRGVESTRKAYRLDDYGKTWLAYRRKPEGG